MLENFLFSVNRFLFYTYHILSLVGALTESQTFVNQGLDLEKSSKYDGAIKAYDKAIEINPQCSKALHYKGVSLSSLSKSNEAQKAWAKEKEINSKT